MFSRYLTWKPWAALVLLVLALGLATAAHAFDPVVRDVQATLTKMGYSPGPIDGRFGRKTAEAIQAYQRDKGLTVTGKPDGATVKALGLQKAPGGKPAAARSPASTKTKAPGASPGAPKLTTPSGDFVIPFELLEPTWSSWKQKGIKGTQGLFCKTDHRYSSVGVLPNTEPKVTYDSRGMPIAPTRQGSKLTFETDGCKYRWANGMLFKADDKLEFEVVDGLGLVHISGSGSVGLPDGRTIRLP